MRRALSVCGALAVSFGCCGTVLAQVNSGLAVQQVNRLQQLQQFENDTRFQANPEIPAGQRALIDYGGSFSPQYWSFDDPNNDNIAFRAYDLEGYLRMNFDNANEIFLRLRLEYYDFNEGDSLNGIGSGLQSLNSVFDRAYYKFDLANYDAAVEGKRINGDFKFEGGRDLVYWGNGLTMAEVVDGVMPGFSIGNFSVTTVAGITPLTTVDIQPDRPAFDYNTKRGFYGALASVAVGAQHPYMYGLFQQDYNTENVSYQGPITTNYKYNSAYVGVGSSGPISDHIQYGIEGVWEGGNTLSDSSEVQGFQLVPVPQTTNAICAWAGDVKIDYVPQDVNNTRLSLEGIIASGDTNRGLTNTTFNGSTPNTIDRAFNGFGLLSTGLAFNAAVSNLMVFRAGASTFPLANVQAFRRFQIGTDLYLFAKTNSQAPIDQPTIPGHQYLGWEPDLYLNWELASDVTFTVRYGVFFPNGASFPSNTARQFLFTGATFAF
jgi:hypothetical protein